MKAFLTLFTFALSLMASATEPANVYFVHGANVSLQGEHAWASVMFKCLWQSGAKMNFLPVSWESDIGMPWNYHANVSNAFVAAQHLAAAVNSRQGRNVIIAHSLGTMVAAAAIQDYEVRVDKLIMLNSAIPSEAFDVGRFDPDPQNHLVHDDWIDYTNVCWTARWNELFDADDSRSRLTWRGRFASVAPVVVNFYSSGDEVLELYTVDHNPAVYSGVSPSGNWGDRYAWHKQELYKGRYSVLGFVGTTDWSGWGFRTDGLLDTRTWSSAAANSVSDPAVFRTNTVFRLYPENMAESSLARLAIDFHLAYGIPALSPPCGATSLASKGIPSFDMNSETFKPSNWPRTSGGLRNRWLHSDIKDVAYFYTHKAFEKIVEVGGLQ